MDKIPEHLSSDSVRALIVNKVYELPVDGSYEVVIRKIPKTRTSQMNRALHKWCDMVAVKLNDSGWSYWAVLLRRTSAKIKSMRRDVELSNSLSDEFKAGYLEAINEIDSTLPKAQTQWTQSLVKNNLWRPVQQSMFGVESTAKAEIDQYTQTYENLNVTMGEAFGVSVPWPVKKD